LSKDKNIGIIGAGLVGSLLAIYLRKRGYDVSVFERRADMRKSSVYAGRSINLALSNRGIRALEEVGLAEELKKSAIPMNGRMMHDIAGNLSFLPYGKQGQYINSISRSALNIVLMNEAEKLGVHFFFEHQAQRVDLDATTVDFKHSGALIPKTFDRIIGSDGAYSAVRMAMQVTDRFDFSQDYIDHGYKELVIPPDEAGAFQLEKNALHIWPRESFMCTLFFPFEGKPSFKSLKDNNAIGDFFYHTFPDAHKLMPSLLEDFNENPTSSLVTMKCFPWVRNRTLLIGDAAHAVVPFYGQGMNAGFEDCRVLNELLERHDDNWDKALTVFQEQRKPDTDAIAQLALDNFIEMRDLVGEPEFLLRKKIESKLHELFPQQWIPLYSMVTFNEQIRYSHAYDIGVKQRRIMDEVMKRPDIQNTWTSLDLAAIVAQLG
jgi:kynurenine 3-monooxygenase